MEQVSQRPRSAALGKRLAALVAAGALVAAAVALLAGGCGRSPTYRKVQLSTVSSVPARPADSRLALRVAVASVLSPRDSFTIYEGLTRYLQPRLGRPVVLVQRSTYAEINDLMRSGGADLAFVCSGAYVVGARDFGMELLVVPEIDGQSVYYSYLIVPATSPVRRLEDLKGRIFAFSDPLSNSGRLAPAYQLLLRTSELPETFFGRYIFTYSHDRSIEAVAARLVDGAAVDSLVYEFFRESEPKRVEGTQVVEAWGPYGAPPVVVHPGLDRQLREQLRQVLLGMHQDEEGRRFLAQLRIDRFVEADDALYDSVRTMATAIGL